MANLQGHWLPTNGWKVKLKDTGSSTALQLGDFLQLVWPVAPGDPIHLKVKRGMTTLNWSDDGIYQPNDIIQLSNGGIDFEITRKLVYQLVIKQNSGAGTTWTAEEG